MKRVFKKSRNINKEKIAHALGTSYVDTGESLLAAGAWDACLDKSSCPNRSVVQDLRQSGFGQCRCTPGPLPN